MNEKNSLNKQTKNNQKKAHCNPKQIQQNHSFEKSDPFCKQYQISNSVSSEPNAFPYYILYNTVIIIDSTVISNILIQLYVNLDNF